MKRMIFFLVLLAGCSTQMVAQNIILKAREERAANRVENRKSNDPIYATGDTLYLLYDAKDTLQSYYPDRFLVLWEMQKMTREEVAQQDTSWWKEAFLPEIAYEFYFYCDRYGFPKVLTAEDLSRMVVTTRKDFMDFYQREYVRQQGVMKVLGKEEKMVLNKYDFRNHFAAIYVIIPQKNGKYKLYINTEEDDWVAPE